VFRIASIVNGMVHTMHGRQTGAAGRGAGMTVGSAAAGGDAPRAGRADERESARLRPKPREEAMKSGAAGAMTPP